LWLADIREGVVHHVRCTLSFPTQEEQSQIRYIRESPKPWCKNYISGPLFTLLVVLSAPLLSFFVDTQLSHKTILNLSNLSTFGQQAYLRHNVETYQLHDNYSPSSRNNTPNSHGIPPHTY
jgi:hypothetical protein